MIPLAAPDEACALENIHEFERDAVLLLESLLLEAAEMRLDLLFDSAALQLEEPNLFLEFLLEALECLQRHMGQRNRMITIL